MLINFRFENFLSYNKVATFSMTAGNVENHRENILENSTIDLLKFAAIYGANASGKSNLIKALSFAQSIIVDGLKDIRIYRRYNLNHSENKTNDSKFEFEILVGNKMYSYGFSILMAESRIKQEWLYDITDDEVEIFTRDREVIINFDYLNVDEKSKNRLLIYSEDIENNSTDLFLTLLNNSEKKKIVTKDGQTVFDDIYRWFRDVLEVLSPNAAKTFIGMTTDIKGFLRNLENYLGSNDTGIKKVKLKKTDEAMKGIPTVIEKKLRDRISTELYRKNMNSHKQTSALIKTTHSIYVLEVEDGKVNTYELRFIHNVDTTEISYALSEESDGTIRLVELFAVSYNNEKGKVFVIDELDRSLHPLLTYEFVKEFLKKDEMSQLIISTHEDRLLDLAMLRRDEIWFTKKNSLGDSIIYSLSDYEEHFDKKVMDAYLEGRYGGIPQIAQVFTDTGREHGDEL